MVVALGASAGTEAGDQAGDAAPAIRQFAGQARAQVDAEGKVVSVQAMAGLPGAVAKAIEEKVAAMRFAPAMQGDRAVAGVTFVRVAACAEPVDSHYQLTVAYRGNGPSQSGPAAPSLERFDLLREGQRVDVRLDYQVLADGSAMVEKTEFVEGGNTRVSAAIRKALARWVEDSTFEPEQLDGHPIATRMSLPITFEGGQKRSFRSSAAAKQYLEKLGQERAHREISCQAALGSSGRSQAVSGSPFHLLPAG